MTTVTAGGAAANLFVFPSDLDADPAPTVTVVQGVTTVLTTTTGIASYGSGDYGYIWQTSTSEDGTYTVTLSGEIADVAVSDSTTVYVLAGNVYVDFDEIKALCRPGVTSTARDVADLRILRAICRQVERACGGRTFFRDGVASARTYPIVAGRVTNTMRYGEILWTDDVASETVTIETGTGLTGCTWTAVNSDYLTALPMRAINNGDCIEGFQLSRGTFGTGAARVTTDWGYPSIPAPIQHAVSMQMQRLLAREGSPEGIRGNAEWGLVRVPRLDPDIEKMVESFERGAIV